MAAKILSDGRSSRIFRALSETGVALTAFAVGNIVEDPSLFFAVAIVQPGHTTAHAESALVGEIDRLASDPVTPHELQRARNQYARDRIMGRETNQQKASQLAHAVVIHHDIATADGEFDRVMGITAADIQRAARRFLDRSSRLVLTILPLGQTQ
jgi:zinc protease